MPKYSSDMTTSEIAFVLIQGMFVDGRMPPDIWSQRSEAQAWFEAKLRACEIQSLVKEEPA